MTHRASSFLWALARFFVPKILSLSLPLAVTLVFFSSSAPSLPATLVDATPPPPPPESDDSCGDGAVISGGPPIDTLTVGDPRDEPLRPPPTSDAADELDDDSSESEGSSSGWPRPSLYFWAATRSSAIFVLLSTMRA